MFDDIYTYGVDFEGGNAVFWGAMDDTFVDHIFVFLE